MEGWNPFKKKATMGVAEAAAVAGATALAGMGMSAHESGTHEGTVAAAAPLPAVDTMPAEHVDPTAGKTPDSTPEPIVVEQTGVVHPEAMMEEDDSGPEPVGQ